MKTLHTLLVSVVAILPSAFSAEARRPNFLFIIADDQSPCDLKVYDPKSSRKK